MTIKYNETTILYDEENNRWKFELRGRHRSAESLAKAKEFIDKPVNDKEEKPFTRIAVFAKPKYGYNKNEMFDIGEVTSVAESSYGSRKEVWVVVGKTREKRDADNCYIKNDQNAEIITQIKSFTNQIHALEERRFKLYEKLQPITV